MKKNFAAIALLFVMGSFINDHTINDKPFKQLYALKGKWIMKTKRGSIGEEWVKVNNTYLQSRGFFIKGIDTIITERVALTETKEGIFYTSTVEDQNDKKPVPFKLTSFTDHVFVFENTEHDFPKRITYQFVSTDSLHAYIDGGAGSTGNRQDFYYQKVK